MSGSEAFGQQKNSFLSHILTYSHYNRKMKWKHLIALVIALGNANVRRGLEAVKVENRPDLCYVQ
ncbi:hypothetical protein PsJ27TS7_48130 [Paenibacillus dendritiformis]